MTIVSIMGGMAALHLATICKYLEKGVYTIDMFMKRNTSLSKEIKKLQTAEADLMRRKESDARADRASIDLSRPRSTFWIITIP